MRRIKYLLSLLAGFVLVFLFAPHVLAANLSVSCLAGGPCTITPASTPLFQETGWVPGNSVSRTITVANQDSSQSCDLIMTVQKPTQSPANFASVLLSNINNGSTTFVNSNLNSIFTGGPISLDTIAAGSSQIYNWSVTFDPNAGNEFQSANTAFDFNLNFICNPAPTSATQGITLAASTSNSTCGDTSSSSAPILKVVANGNNSVNLSWTAVSPVNHYMIRYGLSSGDYIFGAADVGNVTNFTVNLLSGNTTYYFQVAGVNGCMPGPWSNEALARPGGGVLPAGPAEGFLEQTLGVKTETSPTPLPGPSTTPEAGILGATACPGNYYSWWIPLLIQLIVSFIYIWKRWKDKNSWMVVGLLAIMSQIIHQVLGCNCATGEWCSRYWLLNLIIVLFSTFIYLYKHGNRKPAKN